MAAHKGLSIRAEDFVPNGTWVRQLEGITVRAVVLPVEGILMRSDIDDPKEHTIQMDTRLVVTPIGATDTVRLLAGEAHYKIEDDWISFRELCLRAIERRLKQGLSLDQAQIGAQLYAVATWLEAQGNRGHSDEEIMIGLPTFPIRLLNPECRPFWENIVFFGEGEDRGDYSGWGVHKRRPSHWWMTWLDRFGAICPETVDQMMTTAWDEALAYQTAHAIKRPAEIYMEIDLEQEPTRDIAHRAAALWLLARWAQHQMWRHHETREAWVLQRRLYSAASAVFVNELQYRMDQQPAKRRSKKKTQAARDDWALASTYFYPGVGFDAYRFYAQAYVHACCEVETVPDTRVDFEALPRDLDPISIQTDEAEV